MSDDHGPLRSYEITWKSGHIETVQGHQVTFDSTASSLGFGSLLGTAVATRLEPRFRIHGDFDGQRRTVIVALEADLVCIRDVTGREAFPGGEAA